MSNEEEKRCPACGEEIDRGVEVGAYILCSKCGDSNESRATALRIAKSKHKEKLEKIWAELKKEESE